MEKVNVENEEMKNEMQPCYMCDNAKINPELDDDCDYSACGVGNAMDNHRFMITSGWGKPLAIEFDIWSEKRKQWETYGVYNPNYCPNCGRKIFEYPKKEKGRS